MRAQHLSVPRGQAIDIPLTLDLGSPAPPLVVTLATARNCPIKLWTGDVTLGSPGYSVTIPADQTDRAPDVYWWDVWTYDSDDPATAQLQAIGSLTITAVVRLPA